MMKTQQFGYLLAGCLLLGGCQAWNFNKLDYFHNHSKDYLKSSVVAPLKVPAGLTHETRNTYPLPAYLPAPDSIEKVSLIPPGFPELDKKK